MKRLILTSTLAAFCINFFAQERPASSVREDVLRLNTYPFNDPNPVPEPESAVYPYFSFEKYSLKGEMKDWPCVVLENDYIAVTVVPSLGGKIWTAVEKGSGEPFLYGNHAAKFRMVAMRGPWTSGGIEANFGIIGHVPTTATPVDFYTRENPDGGVSCFVASLELVTRTWWQVEISLPSDKAYFTTRTTFYNPTPVIRPYYHWMNAAYKATDDLELYFPGRYYIGHGGDPHPWPVTEEGRDISRYAQNNFGTYKSYHVIGDLAEFYAAWYPGSQSGSVHHAAYGDKPGMKVWIWGLSRQGMIWENLLSDSDGQYVELQSGRLFNQAAAESNLTPFKQFSFAPYATDRWTEYWYPIKKIGGVVKAGEYGALNVARRHDGCTLAFCPTQQIDDEIVVTADGKELLRKQVTLGVLQTWEVDIGVVPEAVKLKVVLGDEKLVYSEDPAINNLTRPVETPKDFDGHSAYGLYLRGQQSLYMNNLKDAEIWLRKALSLDPYASAALGDLATVCYRRGLYAKVDSLSRLILSVNAYDPDGNILYGLASSRLGRPADATDGFSIAALTPSHRTAGNILLAKEYAKKQQWRQVLSCAEKSLASSVNTIDALLLKMLACRKTGKTDDAKAIFEKLGQDYPLCHTARFEKYLQTGDEHDKKAFLDLIRNELPHETLMETAGWYESAGCYEEAVQLYTLAPQYPIAIYRAAFLLSQAGKNGRELLEQAEMLPVHFVLPSRAETIPALEWAVSQSTNWKNRYYLGILCDFLGDRGKATELMEQCADTPEDYAFYLTRAQYRQGDKKLKDIQRAEQLGGSWRAGLALVKYHEQAKQYGKMYEYAKKYWGKYPDYDVLGLKYASSMVYLQQYKQATDLLSRMVVLPGEGGVEGHVIYRKAWMFQALQNAKAGNFKKALSQIEKAREWPESLGAGKPYEEDIDSRAEDCLSAYCYNKLNDSRNAAFYADREKQICERLKDKQEEMYQTVLQEIGK